MTKCPVCDSDFKKQEHNMICVGCNLGLDDNNNYFKLVHGSYYDVLIEWTGTETHICKMNRATLSFYDHKTIKKLPYNALNSDKEIDKLFKGKL